MAGQWSDDLLLGVVEDAKKANQDIADAVDGLEDAPKRRVLQAVLKGRDEIEDAARDEFATWNELLKQRADDSEKVRSADWKKPLGFAIVYYGSGTLVTLWWVAFLVVYPINAIFFTSFGLPWTTLLAAGGWPLVAGIAAVIAVVHALWIWFSSRHDANVKKEQVNLRGTLDIAGTQARIDAIRLKLRQRGVDAAAHVWRKVINERLRPVYRTEHGFVADFTLEAAIQRSQMVRTPAYANLMFMLENLTGGAIGVAGPRGAGKSTLLQWVCDDRQTRLGNRDVLTVLTAAPVDYQTRDFLLHLFASLCHRTIERLAPGYERTDWKRHVAPALASGAEVWRALFTAALTALLAGAIVWSIGVAWAIGRAYGPAAVPAGSPVAAAAAAGAAPPQRLSVAAELGLTPASLLGASLALLCGGGVALVAVTIRAHRTMPARAPAANPSPAGDAPRRFELPWRRLLRWHASIRRALTPQADALPPSDIVQEALNWLQEIKFQQSYTLGWTGALKMPLGVEGSLTQARSLAQQQLTLPELVDAYKRFLAKVAARDTVVIGIDELDKIESDEKAQRFLNDIKVVFGVYNVFFLVSVSENAMSQFERRGLPFRDAFDSAFDDVVIVDHLRFTQSRRLLEERIVALPVQFQALCHVMSAGLARELVRTLRDLVRAAKDAGGNTPVALDDVARRLVEAEIGAKVAAFRTLAERLPPSPDRAALLLQVHRIASVAPTAAALYDSHRALLPRAPARRRWFRAAPAPQPAQDATVLALNEELATYLQFLAAVVCIFTSRLDEAATRQADDRGAFDELAAARRAQSINQSLARSLVDKVLGDMRLSAAQS
jgi:Kef-type K+ transport system membrane component KefB